MQCQTIHKSLKGNNLKTKALQFPKYPEIIK
jgi:hypothetical protein